jgi:hypothetical protein
VFLYNAGFHMSSLLSEEMMYIVTDERQLQVDCSQTYKISISSTISEQLFLYESHMSSFSVLISLSCNFFDAVKLRV